MKIKLIIHGGMHKTGSSAIQTLLQDNRNALNERGVLFPLAGTMHHQGIGRRHFYVRETLFGTHEAVANLLPEVLDEIIESGCHTAILSYENFFSPGSFSAEAISFVQDNFDVYFLCYLRDPVSYFNAKYKEWLRRLNFKGGSGDFVLSHFGYIDWQRMLEPWVEHFGAERVCCRKFDKPSFLGGRIEYDFLDYLNGVTGIEFSDLKIGASVVNASFNNDQALASLLRNRYFGGHKALSPRQRDAYRTYIQSINGATSKGVILSRNTAMEVKSRSKRSLDFVARNMGVEIKIPAISAMIFDDDFYCVDKRARMKRSLERVLSCRSPILLSSFKRKVLRRV